MFTSILTSLILSLLSLFPIQPLWAEQSAEAYIISQEEADADIRSGVESHYLCISSPQGYLFSVEESNGAPVSQTNTEFSRKAPGVKPDFRFLHIYTILSTKFSGNLSYKRALHTLCLLRI